MVVFNPASTGPMKFVHSFDRKIGGAELNLAIGCSRLGLNAGFISNLGKDEFGKYIETFARGEGIDVSQVKFVEGYPTSINFKEISEGGSGRTFYYRDKSPVLEMQPDDLDENYFKQAKILHLTGIFPAIASKNMAIFERAIQLAKKHELKISFDPNVRLRMWSKEKAKEVLSAILPHVDILLAGDEEMEILIGKRDPHAIIEKIKTIGIPYIVIKQGEKGATGYADGELMKMPAVKADKVVDTVGAGDGFNAGVLYGYLHNWPLERTLQFANTIGSMVVSVYGDNEGLPYYEDVQAQLGEVERIER